MKILSQPNPPDFRQRATQLLDGLSDEGSSAQRRQQATQALDTLTQEFSRRPETDLVRIAKAMAERERLDAVAEMACRMGLSAAAEGVSGAGNTLAALAVNILKETPVAERAAVTQKAFQQLEQRPDLQPILHMKEQIFPENRFFTFLNGGDETADEVRASLLESAAKGASQAQAASSLYHQLGAEFCDGKRTKTLIKDLAEHAPPDERKTWRLAATMMNQGWFDHKAANQVAPPFLVENLPHTPSGRAQRLSYTINKPLDVHARQAGLQAFVDELKTSNNGAWKFVDLGASLNPPSGLESTGEVQSKAIKLALDKVGDLAAEVSPQQLWGFLADVSRLTGNGTRRSSAVRYSGLALLQSVESKVRDMLPEGPWRNSMELAMASQNASYTNHLFPPGSWKVFDGLAKLKSGQSPILAVCQSFASITNEPNWDDPPLSRNDFSQLLYLAQSKTSRPHDVAAIRHSLELLQAGDSTTAVDQYLRKVLDDLAQ